MKKKLYFENRADALKEANSIHTYVNFVYDTTDKKLYLYDSFGGEVKKYQVTMTEVEETTSGTTSGVTGG